MNRLHLIRLKGPWQYRWELDRQPGEHSLPFPTEGRFVLPSSWEDCFGETSGTVIWSRRFQRPTNLESHERVLIGVSDVSGICSVALNDQLLADDPGIETGFLLDVTAQLLPSNVLTIRQSYASDRNPQLGGLHQPIRIEIHSTAS